MFSLGKLWIMLLTMEVLRSLMHKCVCEERCNLQFGFQTRYVMFESSVAKQKTYIENRETL